jgi:hypothetical protein
MDRNTPSRGLGDDIKKITSATRLDQLTDKIFQLLNMDCGCDDRQEWVNEKTKNWSIYKKNRNKDK